MKKRENERRPSRSRVRDVLNRHKSALMSRPNVNGVGIQEEKTSEGKTQETIQVYVSKKVPPEKLGPREMVPKKLEDIEVRVQEIGRLALEDPGEAGSRRENSS